MNELRLIRGTQLDVYVGEEPLFGLLSLSASQKVKYHDVYEYLSAAPCERVPQGTEYELTLRFLSLFDGQLPENESFTLTVEDGDTRYIYHDCRMLSRKMEVKGNEYAEEVITAAADAMEKQVTEHE